MSCARGKMCAALKRLQVFSNNRESGYEAARVTGACNSVGWCLKKNCPVTSPDGGYTTYTRRSIGDGRMAEARRNGRQTHRDRSTIYKSCDQHESLVVVRYLVGEGYMFQDMGVRGLGYKECLVAQAHFRRIRELPNRPRKK